MLRERPELFYPVYYIAPQHYSAWQASSSSFAQPQVSSQEYYASGYVGSVDIRFSVLSMHSHPVYLVRGCGLF